MLFTADIDIKNPILRFGSIRTGRNRKFGKSLRFGRNLSNLKDCFGSSRYLGMYPAAGYVVETAP